MWDKIVNPKTRRRVNINSKIGQKVLNNYLAYLNLTGGGDRVLLGEGAHGSPQYHQDAMSWRYAREVTKDVRGKEKADKKAAVKAIKEKVVKAKVAKAKAAKEKKKQAASRLLGHHTRTHARIKEALLPEYRASYPEVRVRDGISYTCILAKPGMPYVLLIGETHPIKCEDSSRILSQPAIMEELLKDGDHFLLEDAEQNHDSQWINYIDDDIRINKLRQELKHCLSAKWKEGKELYVDRQMAATHDELAEERCKYQNKKVQFHWLDYGLYWDTNDLQVIPKGFDKHKLNTDATYREEVTTMFKNSLVRPLLGTEAPQETAILTVGGPIYTYDRKTRPCRYLDEEDCLGYRNHEFPGGTCVFDNRGVQYQNEAKWYDAELRPEKCRSIYDYIHHERRKVKCDGFQMPTEEALAKWFVSEVAKAAEEDDFPTPDENLQWQNYHIIRRIMDVYTLLRMFRQFTEPAKRCIVYAGAKHSTALVKLLVDTQGYVILDEKYMDDEVAQANYANALTIANDFSAHVNKMTPDERARELPRLIPQMKRLSDNVMQAKAQADDSCRLWGI